MPRTNNEMIAAKLPYQRFRCLKICKTFQYSWRKKREEYRHETGRSSLHSYAARAQERVRSAVDFNLRAMLARENQADTTTPNPVRMAAAPLPKRAQRS